MVATPRGNRFALGCALVITIVAAGLPLQGATDRFGPKSYAVVAKHTLQASDSFAVSGPCDGAAAIYTLVVKNGNADGTQRIKKGSVTLNGTEVVSDNELKSSVAIVTKTVTPAASNTLAVDFEGDNTAGSVTITLTRTIDLVSTVFPEKSYPLTTAKSGTFQETFTVANPTGTFTLVVKNGTVQTRPMDDVRVVLNGTEIITKKDIDSRGNQDERQTIVKPVTLQASNTLQIEMKTNKTPAVASLQILRHAADTEAPAITVTAPAEGASVTSPVTVTGTVADLGGVATLTINGAAVTPGANGAFTASVTLAAGATQITLTATDCEGNARTKTIAVVQGVNAPPQVAILSPTGGGFSKSATVVVSGSASDASGIAGVTVNGVAATVTGNTWTASITFPAVSGTVDGTKTIAATATDRTGQTASASMQIVVDTTPPAISGTVAPVPNAAGWNGANAVITFTCTDALSGIASCTAPVTITSEGLAQTASGTAVDRAGNETPVTITVKLDKTPPEATLTAPAPTGPLYNVTSLTLDGTAADVLSGLAAVTCNGAAATRTGSSFRCTLPLTAGPNGVAVVATDVAGNATTITRTYTVVHDLDPPVIAADVEPTASAAGWLQGPASVQFVCTDAISGVSQCSGGRHLETDGANQTLTGTAVDGAGNTASLTVTVNVDRTAPQLSVESLPRETTLTVRDAALTVTGTASDATSGVASIRCNGAMATLTGSQFSCSVPLSAGANGIFISAKDRAGNETSQGFRVNRDITAPDIMLDSPRDATVTLDGSVRVAGTADDDTGIAAVRVNGSGVALTGHAFDTVVALQNGTNDIVIEADDTAGNRATRHVAVTRQVPALSVAIRSPVDLETIIPASITVTGTMAGGVTGVDVNGIIAAISGTTFTAAGVPLSQGRTVITATASDAGGRVTTSTIHVYHDTIPPRVVVRYPADNSTVHQSPISVVGMIDDIVVGTINPTQVAVKVNGIDAEVANRAFVARNVPLAAGLNSLLVSATDQGGNVTTIAYRVTLAAGGAGIETVSGDGQTAPIGAALPQPLVARVRDAAGAPVAGENITFRVIENNGTLSTGTTTAREITVATDASGQASVRRTLGTRAGAGNNRIEARIASGAVQFFASATPGAPALLVVDSGNSQFGATGGQLARPLVAVAVDSGSNRLANVAVTFRVVAGGGSVGSTPAVTVRTDSDGRAWVTPALGAAAGNDNNVFQASLASGSAVTFVASGRTSGPPAETRISGVIVDNSNLPIPGVTVRIDGTPLTAQSDGQGIFTIAHAPVGYVKLFVDGSTAQRPGTWPMLEYAMYTIAGVDNHLEMPVFLLPIDVVRGITVDEQHGGTLTLPELPGFSLTVAPGSATFPSGTRAGTVSVTLVHADKMPMSPGFGQQPRFLVTIQPPGTHFDPPAQITFPNVDGLAPGEITEMYSFDHDLGQFVAIGTGSISADGSVLASDPGVGIIKGGWHCGGNPVTSGTASCLNVGSDPQDGFNPSDSGGGNNGNASASTNAAVYAPVGSTIDVVASGTPEQGGSYSNWEIISDPSDPNNDPSAAQFVTTPSCAGLPTCTAKLKGLKGGTVTVRVTFTSTTAGGSSTTRRLTTNAGPVSVQSPPRKITFVQVAVGSLTFENNQSGLTKDLVGLPSLLIPPTQWARSSNGQTDPVQESVWYLHSKPNTKRKIRILVGLEMVQKLKTDAKVTIFGTGGGLNFYYDDGTNGTSPVAKPLTLPQDTANVAREFVADDNLPETTKLYDPLTIVWKMTVANGQTVEIGTTGNPVYVSLDPLGGTAVAEPVTIVQLAVADGGASTKEQARDQTWGRFSGRLVTTWNKEPLFYYDYVPSVRQPWTGEVTADELLKLHNGQCRTFVDLLRRAWGVNGVTAQPVRVLTTGPLDTTRMLVNNWSVVIPAGGGFYEVPYPDPTAPLPLGQLGFLFNQAGVSGQHTSTPAAKIFKDHVILQQTDLGIALGIFYDPSYGVTYTGPGDFAQAIWGFGQLSNGTLYVKERVASNFSIMFGPE